MVWLQIITALFAASCALLNKWPVLLMRAYWTEGAHRAKERQFHAANAAVKVLWSLSPCIAVFIYQGWLRSASLFALLLLIQWLVFDIVLNVATGKPPFYLGKTAWLDRLVKHGLIKALALLVLIGLLNFLLRN